ncbi:MAG: acyl-CoA dehydrogenase family protein [Deltaproteobacteria bacterium]|nr:acyl-CoA dehydrogenase family protein [Deltaproteobacteria bacterium]MBW2448052.1 acyl-CoA dehydrogenase family protein [Deltaproteobacteria bacterium]
MISFGPNEEQEIVRDAMREFAEQALRTVGRECDESASVPDDLLQQVWELGLTATQIPEEYGGGGEDRSPITNILVLEELAYGDASLAAAAVTPSLFANAVLDYGTEEQKAQYLPLFTGEKFHAASLAMVEPGALFDVLNLRTKAEPKGDGFVLSGQKSFVPLGDRAQHFLVLAHNTAQDGFEGIEAFIVPRDTKGLTISEPEKNLGLKGLPTVGLTLDRVEVAAAERLGGEAGIDARRLVAASRTAIGAVLVGMSRAVLEYAIPYAKDREAFGEAIAKKQAIAFMLSDMRIEVDSMRWLVWKAASELEHGLDATRSAHLARVYCAREGMRIADNGVQVLGGHGFIREHPVEMWYRNARTLGVLEGSVTC